MRTDSAMTWVSGPGLLLQQCFGVPLDVGKQFAVVDQSCLQALE